MTALLEMLSENTTLHRGALDLSLELCLLCSCPGTALGVLGLANSAKILPTLRACKVGTRVFEETVGLVQFTLGHDTSTALYSR